MKHIPSETLMHAQEFTYRTSHYTPQAPVAGFVNFLSNQYYTPADEKIVETVRRAMGEFTNDARLQMALSVFSNRQQGDGHTLMNEQYTAYALDKKMFSVSMVSGDDLQVPGFVELDPAVLHPVKRATDRFYTESGIQFVSIYHQLQNLVRSLSNDCRFYAHYNAKQEKYYVMARPLDQALKKYADGQPRDDDRFQVLIMLHIPPVEKLDG